MVHADCNRFRAYRLPLVSRFKLKNIFPGEWESIYTGEGIEFTGSHPYEPGDDLRDLDLQTLVQSGEEEIIQRVVGRQRPIYLWVDVSGSMQRARTMFFAGKPVVRDNAVGLLAFAAWQAYSPVGLCAFDREVRRFFPARSGASHCEEIVGWFLGQIDQGPKAPADMRSAVAFMEQRIPAQSMVLFISDFQDPVFEGDFAPLLKPAAKKFDLIPVVIRDPLESGAALRWPVVVAVRDNEGKRESEMTLTPARLGHIQQASARHLAHLEQNLRDAGLDPVILSSADTHECFQTLAGFFQARRRIRG